MDTALALVYPLKSKERFQVVSKAILNVRVPLIDDVPFPADVVVDATAWIRPVTRIVSVNAATRTTGVRVPVQLIDVSKTCGIVERRMQRTNKFLVRTGVDQHI